MANHRKQREEQETTRRETRERVLKPGQAFALAMGETGDKYIMANGKALMWHSAFNAEIAAQRIGTEMGAEVIYLAVVDAEKMQPAVWCDPIPN